MSPTAVNGTSPDFGFRQARLRGVNLGGWFSQIDDLYAKDPERNPGLHAHLRSFLCAADFGRIRNWGFNHVRLPVDYYNVFGRTSLLPDETVLTLLAENITHATAAGLGLILDLHRYPATISTAAPCVSSPSSAIRPAGARRCGFGACLPNVLRTTRLSHSKCSTSPSPPPPPSGTL
jgi:hypothetical protein